MIYIFCLIDLFPNRNIEKIDIHSYITFIEIVEPPVNAELLKTLQSFGYGKNRSIRALEKFRKLDLIFISH